ncbi:MAG TPA: serine/threonine protein kinase [Chloroflexi bacterium]|nr:serine/threonine protein kinase [Chloroflexota bacterium]
MDTDLDHIKPGSVVGPYRVVRGFKGRGGMARVVEVEVREKYRQPTLPPRLALKVAREEYQDALVAESDYLRRFDHPGVVRIYPLAGYHRPVYAARERFPFGWGWYYTMELLSRKSLKGHLTSTTAGLLRPSSDEGRPIGLLKTLGIGRQLTRALDHIHAYHVINLDIKPGNILLRQKRFQFLRSSVPQVVLCDFGVARDTRYPRSGLLGVATPAYVSPEQALELGKHHQHLDNRSDIFSLGIVLYEMLTGIMPFDNILQIVDPAYTPAPPGQIRRSIPPQMDDVVMKALAKHPLHRFQTAVDMQAALDQVPTPCDWEAIGKRTFAGVTLAACLAAGSWGAGNLQHLRAPTPTLGPTRTVTPSPLASSAPVPTPESTLLPTATPCEPTSTPAPTFTPTRTPRPMTPTFTPTPTPGED